MNVEIGTEGTQFPEKKYINGIFVAMYSICSLRVLSYGETVLFYVLKH
jgi:hypothetical protein